MNWQGVAIGIASFLVIGIFHPIVIKAEYHWGKGSWWLFATAGLALLSWSLYIESTTLSGIVAVTSFSCFWSIFELFQQEKRVQRGWFPANPKRQSRRSHIDT